MEDLAQRFSLSLIRPSAKYIGPEPRHPDDVETGTVPPGHQM